MRDTEILPHLLRPNPHRSTYSNMMLFLREQVEAFAFSDQKWGSPEALDEEFERREAERKKKKNKKFEQSLKDLRRRTTTNRWHQRKEAEHEHTFSEATFTNAEGQSVKQCSECGVSLHSSSFRLLTEARLTRPSLLAGNRSGRLLKCCIGVLVKSM